MKPISEDVQLAGREERDRVLRACLLPAVTVSQRRRDDPAVTLTQLSKLFGIAAFHAPANFLPGGVNGFIDAVTARRLADLLPEPLRQPDDKRAPIGCRVRAHHRSRGAALRAFPAHRDGDGRPHLRRPPAGAGAATGRAGRAPHLRLSPPGR